MYQGEVWHRRITLDERKVLLAKLSQISQKKREYINRYNSVVSIKPYGLCHNVQPKP